MKTIIAVTFIGILTYALEEKSSEKGPTECNKPAMTNFNSEKYLKFIPPYVTHSKYDSEVTVCRVSTTATTNGTVDTDISGYYHERGVIYHYEDLCRTSEEIYKQGQFLADCKIVKDTYYKEKEFIPITYKHYLSVVDTDYENYAILYTCYKDEETNKIEDDYEVLQMNPTGSEALVKEALTKLDMNLEEFAPKNATNCQNENKDKKNDS